MKKTSLPPFESRLLTSPLYRPGAEPATAHTPHGSGVVLLPLPRKAAARPIASSWPLLLRSGSQRSACGSGRTQRSGIAFAYCCLVQAAAVRGFAGALAVKS